MREDAPAPTRPPGLPLPSRPSLGSRRGTPRGSRRPGGSDPPIRGRASGRRVPPAPIRAFPRGRRARCDRGSAQGRVRRRTGRSPAGSARPRPRTASKRKRPSFDARETALVLPRERRLGQIGAPTRDELGGDERVLRRGVRCGSSAPEAHRARRNAGTRRSRSAWRAASSCPFSRSRAWERAPRRSLRSAGTPPRPATMWSAPSPRRERGRPPLRARTLRPSRSSRGKGAFRRRGMGNRAGIASCRSPTRSSVRSKSRARLLQGRGDEQRGLPFPLVEPAQHADRAGVRLAPASPAGERAVGRVGEQELPLARMRRPHPFDLPEKILHETPCAATGPRVNQSDENAASIVAA